MLLTFSLFAVRRHLKEQNRFKRKKERNKETKKERVREKERKEGRKFFSFKNSITSGKFHLMKKFKI
jgi:hypothetical protein